MKLQVNCPNCETTYALPAKHAGKKFRCKSCQHVVDVPLDVDFDVPASKPKRKATKQSTDDDGLFEALDELSAMEESARPLPGQRSRKRRRDEDEVIDEDDDLGDEYERDPATSVRMKKRKKRKVPNEFKPTPFYLDWLLLCSVAGVCLLMLGLVLPYVSLLVFPIAFLFLAWGQIALIGMAFEDDIMVGFLYVFIAPYSVYFIFSRMPATLRPFLAVIVGSILLVMTWLVQITTGS